MPTIVIDQFSPIDVTANSTDSVDIHIESSNRLPTVEILGIPLIKSRISDNKLRIIPDPVWVPGSTFSIRIAGVPTGDTFAVREDTSSYNPAEYLYSKGLLHGATLATLVEHSFLTQDEHDLLSGIGPDISKALQAMSDCLCYRFFYNGTESSSHVRLAICFRVMQQIFFNLGMASFVESILFSPGPNRSWFNSTYISLRKLDSEVKELFPIVKTHTDAARAAISKAGLNTEVIDSVALQIAPTHPLHDVAIGIATLFCAIRYSHDNDRFSY